MRKLIASILMALSLSALADPSTDDLAVHLNQRLAKHPVLRAEFVQRKQMTAFKKPLVSKGQMVFIKGQGVLWKIDSPLKLTYVLTDDRITEISEDGSYLTRGTQEVPGLAQVSRIFRGLLGAQTNVLKDMFSVTAEGTFDSWRMMLTPNAGPASQYMRQITLSGSRYLEGIRIDEVNGDTTTISFRNTAEVDMPTIDERALLVLK